MASAEIGVEVQARPLVTTITIGGNASTRGEEEEDGIITRTRCSAVVGILALLLIIITGHVRVHLFHHFICAATGPSIRSPQSQVTLIATALAACCTLLLYAACSTHAEQVIIMKDMGVLLQRQSLLDMWLGALGTMSGRWHVHAFINHTRICGTTVVEQIGWGEVFTRVALVVDHGQHMYLLGQHTCRRMGVAVKVYRAAATALRC